MAVVLNQQHITLARTLPPKLLSFFARYPPGSIFDSAANKTAAPTRSTTLNTSSSDPNASLEESTLSQIPHNNPFRYMKHPVTGIWHEPRYSLRRQADLVKLAREHGVEELLPPTSKNAEERLRKREEHGLRVKGTGVGQRVKGHWRERTLKGRLEVRRQAMLKMPEMIRKWRITGHSKGVKKWPK